MSRLPSQEQLVAEAHLSGVLRRRCGIDIFQGSTTFEMRRDLARRAILPMAGQRVVDGKSLRELFEGVYREPLEPPKVASMNHNTPGDSNG